MNNFTLEIGPDGVALLTWDMAGRSMNVIDWEVMREVEEFVARIAADEAITGAVITSGKATFSGGADLAMLADLEGEAESVFEKVGRFPHILRKLETCGKPVAAAINGTALGGAFELCLACHYRVCKPDKEIKLGLPESKVGLLPGAGGTQRLPRLVGAKEALTLMLKGTHFDPAQALKIGAVHALSDDPVAAARQWILASGKAVQPWDEKGFAPPGGLPFAPQGMMMWAAANALYRKESYDNYDAQRAIMSCVFEGLAVKSIDAGLLIEQRYFTSLMMGRQSKAMIRSLFHSMQALGKGARRPQAAQSKVTRLGMVGAGFMGAGIAYVTALAGIDVVLIDRDMAAAEKGKAHSAGLLDKRIARGETDAGEKEKVLGRIHPSTDYADLAECDLVIEAVFENKQLKAEVWPRIDAALGPDAVRASNTSTLPITGLARHVKDKRNFIGIHFFSPVDRMQLVEIIMGKETSPETLARALDYVRQIRKTPIVVNDSHGFFTSRVVMKHIEEGHWMLEEGIPAALIENAGKMAGMPVGPLALADEVALDLSWKIQEAAKAELGPRYQIGAVNRLLEEMVVKRERFGRKNGKGYYDYPPGAKKRLWPGIAGIAPPKSAAEFDARVVGDRLLLIQALETARCFAENVLTDVREADVGAILGFGFAPFTGGPLSWIDGMGVANFVAKCRNYERLYGARYAPPSLLIEMGEKGETFYGRFAPPVAHAA